MPTASSVLAALMLGLCGLFGLGLSACTDTPIELPASNDMAALAVLIDMTQPTPPDLTPGPDLAPLCRRAADCGGGPKGCCAGSCVDVTNDASNCGACGLACPAGSVCCAGHCADFTKDASNCGACGVTCQYPMSAAACANSTCTRGACQPYWGDCNNSPIDGCETSLRGVKNCGKCGTVCAIPNAIAGCDDMGCYLSACLFGWDDCNLDPADGCEISVLSDGKNCGACGNVCSAANARSTCTTAACSILSCNQGYFDCDGKYGNGCEVLGSSDAKNCGGCGVACAQGLICKGSQCTCPNCNIPNASSKCANNVCILDKCNPGWADCDGNAANGCEQNVGSDIKNCGACGVACVNKGEVCFQGKCQVGCVPDGNRAAFNTLSAHTSAGCWMGNPCVQDNYQWSNANGESFIAFGQSLDCSGPATCVGNVGITTYSGSNTVCQGSWDVYCDGNLVGNILTLGRMCAGQASKNGCSISFNPVQCSTIQLVAVTDNDNTAGCCGLAQPDSMVTAVSAW